MSGDLTSRQLDVLQAVGRRPYLQYGQDGVTATGVIRRLQSMGLLMVNPNRPRPGGWSAALTENGRQKLAEVNAEAQP